MNRFPFRITLVIGMFLLLGVLGSSAAVLAQDEPAPAAVDAACVPGAKEVVVFQNVNYGGKCAKMKIGRFATPAAMKIANDTISSIKVGSAVRAVAFEDVDFEGDVSGFNSDNANLATDPDPDPIGDNNISSMKVELKPTTGCNPRPNEIAVFEDANYGGQCMLHNVGNYRASVEMGLPEDVISSVKVGNLLRVVFYRNDYFNGTTGVYTANDNSLLGDDIGNDTVSSFRVDLKAKAQKCKAGPTQVAFFEHDQYKGRCVVKDIGTYPNALTMGIDEDFITSLRIGGRVKVIVYTWTDFGGDTATYTTNISNLYYEPIGNDTISSVKIVSR